jgi:hypothetical protein
MFMGHVSSHVETTSDENHAPLAVQHHTRALPRRQRLLSSSHIRRGMFSTIRYPSLTTGGSTGSTFIRDGKLSIRPFGETAPYGRHPNVCRETGPRFLVGLSHYF